MVGTDLSESSLAVLDYVPRLREFGLERVILAHVVYAPDAGGAEHILLEQAQEDIKGQAERLREAGLEVETIVKWGTAPRTLSLLADKHEAEILVVGSHGRSMLQRMLLGSVAMSLLHHATKPVLIVRMELCETDDGISCEVLPGKPFSHILFPTDFSDAANTAFEWFKPFAAEMGSRVTVLHAVDRDAGGAEQEDADRLDRRVEELQAAGLEDATAMLEVGFPADVIDGVAAEEDVSMIVMSTHGRGALRELVVGSVALKVARSSPVPVMLIPFR